MPFPALTDFLNRPSTCRLITVTFRELQKGVPKVKKRRERMLDDDD